MPGSHDCGQREAFWLNVRMLPSSFTWRDLKDMVRKVDPDVGWTDMDHASPGSGVGWVTIKSRRKAREVFEILIRQSFNGRHLEVHLFDVTRNPPTFLGCTCENNGRTSCHPSDAGLNQMSQQILQIVYPQTINIVTNGPTAPAIISGYPTPYYSSSSPSTTIPGLARASAAYVPAYGGTPVNVRYGTVRTEARGIFINGLKYSITQQSLQSYLSQAGTLRKCELQRDPSTGKSKGSATAQYSSREEAQRAVKMFNREDFGGMRINVRLDKEQTAISTQPSISSSRRSGCQEHRQPVIVNGSTASSRRQSSA